ncbi:MAG: rhamnan synthesis F family protein [Actinomycetaceae bacterium]|nr:rhamnan synthesis F family protein [Actinomycetaceae bacterium]
MKRIAFYLFWDRDGIVDEYVTYCLEKLRPSVDRIVVVTNGPANESGRQALECVADEVIERENVGFDVWGYKEGIERYGRERLAEFDELLMLNYTFFGPIQPFEDVFARTDMWDVDFWGLTEHDEVTPHPFVAKQKMPRHYQSHWLAVRKSMFMTQDFFDYWATMPMIGSYSESVDLHEARFAGHFKQLGYRGRVLFDVDDYPDMNPVLDNVVMIARDGLPILKRRTFFHDPLYMSDRAIIGRDVIDVIEQTSDYPVELIWKNIARTAEPRVAATNFSLMRIHSDALEIDEAALAAVQQLRTVAICHCFYPDMATELLELAANVPGHLDVVLTTDTEEKKAEIERAVQAFEAASPGSIEGWQVRVVASNAGRDISAFLIGCADVLRDDSYDLVVKIHSKRSPQDGAMAGEWFKRHLFGNLLGSKNYARNLFHLFVAKPEVGMAVPPVIHIGYPTMGKAWYSNKPAAKKLLAKLGLTTALDASTPLSAYGSMFIARPAALRPLVDAGLTWTDFEGEYGDGSLAHVIERIFTYSSLGVGMPVYEVANTKLAEINYMFLEYKLQNFSQELPGTVMQQRAYLDSIQGVPNIFGIAKGMLYMRHPKAAKALKPAYQVARRGYRVASTVGRTVAHGGAAAVKKIRGNEEN